MENKQATSIRKGLQTFFLTLFLFVFSLLHAQQIPKVKGYVIDEANFLSQSEQTELSQDLQALDDSTSVQMVVYIAKDLAGLSIEEFATEFGRKNGIGQKASNNGLVFIVKPKTADEKGRVYISPGYGLEGAIPDAVCKRIIENEVLPQFRQNQNYAGIRAGISTLSKLASGEFNAKSYLKKKDKGSNGSGIIVFFIILVFAFVFFSGGKKYGSRNNLPFWMALGMLNSMGSKHRGTYSDFNSGGGGFGGFGGGSFGGGGAGGSW